jgi:co-chaperonin GroES (HSP10)
MLKALGPRLLIKPEFREKKPAGENRIIIVEDDRRGIAATEKGWVVDIGPNAYYPPEKYGQPWCKVGDKVIYAKYGGKIVTDPDTNEQFLVINDEDVIVGIEEPQQ